MQGNLIEDLHRTEQLLKNPSVMKTTSLFGGRICPSDVELAKCFHLFTKDFERHGVGFYKLFNEDREFVGIAGACIGRDGSNATRGQPEIGYFILPEHQGNGYASLALEHTLQSLQNKGFKECKAETKADNLISKYILEKHGFKSNQSNNGKTTFAKDLKTMQYITEDNGMSPILFAPQARFNNNDAPVPRRSLSCPPGGRQLCEMPVDRLLWEEAEAL